MTEHRINITQRLSGWGSHPTLTVLAAAAQHDVVDPVCVVLHGLDVRVALVLAVPYSDDGVSAGRVEPLQVWVILQGVDGGSVMLLDLITDHKGYLECGL